MMRRYGLIQALVLLCLPVGAGLSSDCSQLTRAEAFRAADLVFRGRVAAVDEIMSEEVDDLHFGKVPVHHADSSQPYVVKILGNRTWKGPSLSTVLLFGLAQPPQGTGFHFRVGSEYIVYVTGPLEPSRQWGELRRASHNAPVYEISTCPLRITTDLSRESRALDKLSAGH